MDIIKAEIKHIKFIVSLAAKNCNSIGFIPYTKYELISLGKLPNANLEIIAENGDFIGFCYFGSMQVIRIFQLCFNEDARRKHFGTQYISDLSLRFYNHEKMTCRIANDLEAIQFWITNGFKCIDILEKSKRGRPLLCFEKPLCQLYFESIGGITRECLDQDYEGKGINRIGDSI